MTHLIAQIRDAMAKRAQYKRTVAELANLPADIARDVGITTQSARQVAHRSVYGF